MTALSSRFEPVEQANRAESAMASRRTTGRYTIERDPAILSVWGTRF
jgi:hypothetical protein